MTTTEHTTRDLDRYSSIRERDIDLVVCASAAAIPGVWKLFREELEPPRTEHSVSDRTGEIDIVLKWSSHTVHVENKIAAAFQPTQAERYRNRAIDAAEPTTTVLLAPALYLDSHPEQAEMFHKAVSYESLAEALVRSGSPLAAELRVTVVHAIAQHRRGPISILADGRTAFFNALPSEP